MSHATAGLPTGPADRAPSRLPVRASLLAAPMIDKLKFHITRLRRMQFGRQGSTTFSRSMGHSGFDAVYDADRTNSGCYRRQSWTTANCTKWSSRFELCLCRQGQDNGQWGGNVQRFFATAIALTAQNAVLSLGPNNRSGVFRTRGGIIESSDALTATLAVIPAKAGTQAGPRFRGNDDRG
jgi:hypothetical protein